MKLAKLSLATVLALGTSAYAIDNVKVSGDAKVWYQTSETAGTTQGSTNGLDFFGDGANSIAEISITAGVTADLLQNLSAGVSVTGLTTLGLENNLVGDVPSNKIKSNGTATSVAERVSDQAWLREAYLAYSIGKTTAKIGRQELNTPLAFTEKWNVVDNTFEAAVLLNNDLPDTTLVAAWVGKHNGIEITGSSTVTYKGAFGTFASDGAYAFGAVNKTIPNTTVQGWYYNVCDVADAYWLQADTKLMGMIDLGLQYANMSPNGGDDTSIYAVKVAADVAGFNVYGAYSSADESDTLVNFSNVSTGDKSNIYTALGSIYMDGEFTTRSGTDAWKIGASTKMVPGVTLAASYGESETDNTPTATKDDRNAWDISANTLVGPVALTAIYTQFEVENAAGAKTNDTDTLRLIASLKF